MTTTHTPHDDPGRTDDPGGPGGPGAPANTTGPAAAPTRRGPLRRLASLPLRSRLALLVTTAVTVAVALAAVACWLLTQSQLRSQLDSSLESLSVSRGYLELAASNCQESGPAPSKDAPPSTTYVQLVRLDGGRCVGPGSTPVKVQESDTHVARHLTDQAWRDGVTDTGEAVRVFTHQDSGTGLTVSFSRPLAEVDGALNQLALVLLAVAGLGVLGAGAAGLWVARTGLRPVDRLTDAVEHVARTEDLTVRIPVEGEDEIARLSLSFNAMTSALASSRDRQAQLIADAGHELRTPLTSLRTNVELLARSDETGRAIPPTDRAELMASVKAQMTELASLIGDLQELARPDTAIHGSPPQVVALHEIATAALERARLRGPELTITSDLAPWYVRAEPATLERALVNVLDNAVKFSPPGATVDVVLRRGELTVRDHGPGIPDDELPLVFDRFWRSPSARALPGSGLGLSIVARTVQHAGGTIALRRPPDGDGGTEALIRLPGAPTPPPDDVM